MKEKNKDDEVDDEYAHLTYRDYKFEAKMIQYGVYWDFDITERWSDFMKLVLIRLALIMSQVHLIKHPDEVLQGSEVAYRIINGQSASNPNGVQMLQTWEWWTGYGLRTHVYPLWLSLPGLVFKAVGLDTNFIIVNSVHFQHMLILVLGDYFGFKFVRQLIGRQEALIALVIALIHEHSNNYILRTSVNGVESSMLYVVFYHFINMKPQFFNKHLTCLTMAITATFVVRSSSIIGYVPLALIAIYHDQRYLMPIVVAGLTVAIPMVALSLYIDSCFYGYWIAP